MPAGRFFRNTSGDAIVEAVVLFPIMIMIFAALVLLASYLPTRAALQRATQYAATAVATELSDTWLFCDNNVTSHYWKHDKNQLTNVYVALFSGDSNAEAKGEEIAIATEAQGVSSKAGVLTVNCDAEPQIIYREVVVTATREFTVPVDLSFIGFPKTIHVTVTSTAVVQNGDEFVRSMDLAADFVKFIKEKFQLGNVSDAIGSFGNQVKSILGW